MRRIVSVLIMLACLFSSVSIQAAEQDGISAVLVLDTSGSMRGTDKSRVAIEAVKLFIDMMEDSGSQVSVVAFNGTIAKEIPLTKINGAADKQAVKSQLDGLKYDGETDMGPALKRACEILSESGMERNNVIVFFTDGKIDFYTGNTTRTIAQSAKEVDEAVESIKGKLPIYTIGLNANGNVDEEIITKMASETGGEKYVVNDAAELTKIYNTIFAKFIKSGLIDVDMPSVGANGMSTAKINIPNSSVTEANIIATAATPLTDIYAVSPSGELVNSVKSISSRYAMLKLIKPEQGDWTVTVKGASGSSIDATLLFNYNIDLNVNIESDKAYNQGDTLNVLASLSTGGAPLNDAKLYNELFIESIVTKPDGTTENIDMNVADGSYRAQIPLKDSGDYTVSVRADGDNFYRVSDPVTISVKAASNAAAVPVTTENKGEKKKLIASAVIALIALLIIGSRIAKVSSVKRRPLVGIFYVTNEDGDEFECSLGGKKGGCTLYDVTEEITTSFVLKKIKLYFVFDKGSCVNVVNRSPYNMKEQSFSSTVKRKILLKNGGEFVLESGSGDDKKTVRVKYEHG